MSLLATRLDVLTIEIETGRCEGLPREQIRCTFGCGHIRDTATFCTDVSRASKQICSLNRYVSFKDAAKNPLIYWRDIARRLECRWRACSRKLDSKVVETQHLADVMQKILNISTQRRSMNFDSKEDPKKPSQIA